MVWWTMRLLPTTFLTIPHIACFWDNFQLEVFGDASKMGKVIATAPTLKSVAMEGGFSANLNATLQSTPPGLTGPFHVAKKFIR